MTITKRLTKGSSLTYAELDANFTDLSERMGWVDYNDLATTGSPIALTVADTFYNLTNDAAGARTIKTYKIAAHGEIWNTGTDRFDFTDLALGDTVKIRLDVTLTTSGPTRDSTINLDMAIGSGSDYSLPVDFRSFKLAGTYQFVVIASIYMGDTNTLNNPAKFSIANDGTGSTVVVNGWYVKTHVRS